MRVYCIYDKVADESGPLFEAKNDGIALRMFHGVNLPGNPEDFELLLVGEYERSPVKLTGVKNKVIREMTDVEAV